MKKLLLTCMIALSLGVSAQVGPPQATNPNTNNGYGFAQASGTYVPLSASRTVWQSGAALATDAVSSAVPLPFSFKYNARNYSNVFISNNGYITFGSPSTAATYTALSTNVTTAGSLYEGAIAGFAVNLKNANTTTSEISYETVGSKFFIQFTDLQGNSASAAQLISFQIQLDSSNNSVSIVYGACASGTATLTGQVGLKGAESSDMNNRTGTNWTSTAVGTSTTSNCTLGTTGTTSVPASGLTFTYTPGTWLNGATAFASLPFTEDFSNWVNGNSTGDLPNSTYWRTWPSRGDNSWRASNIATAITGFVSSSGWSDNSESPATAITTPAVAPTARFHSYQTTAGYSGYMDLYVNLSTGGVGNRVVSFDYRNQSGTDKLDVLLSTDGGITFSNMGSSLNTSTTWSNKTYTTSSTSSTAIIRFLATADFGSDDIFIDNLAISISAIAPSCTTISTPANAATGVSANPTITWASSSGASSYLINLGTTAGGTNILNGVDVGNVTTYTIPAGTPLNYSTQYFITILPKNTFGTATGCTETSFTTGNIPCPSVSLPAAAATGLSLTPTITWAASLGAAGYKISMGTTSGGTNVLNNFDVGNVLTYTLPTALNSSTTYYYTVNAYTSNSNSSTCSVRNFTTICSVENAPTLSQSFSSYLPTCWTAAKGAVAAASTLTYGTSKWASETGFGNTGSNAGVRINLYDVNPGDWLISQEINLGSTPGIYRVKYRYAVTGYLTTTAQTTLGTHVVRLIVSTDGGSTWSDANVIKTYTGAGTYSNSGQTEMVNLTGYSGSVKIAFVATTSSTSPDIDFHIDDFVVEAIPLCEGPLNVTPSLVTTSSATLSWTAPATVPGNGYEYAFSSTNTTPTSGTPTSALSVPLSPLNPSTTYYYWVRSVCSGSSTSTWVTGSFTTLAVPPTNDACSGATALTPGATFSQNAVTSTNAGATTDISASCAASNAVNNIWFSVVVPASGSITVETGAAAGSPFTDSVLTLFSGACGSLTAIDCNDDIASGSNIFSRVTLTGRTPGEVIYASVYRYSTVGSNGQIQISAYDASLSTSEVSQVKNNLTAYPNPFTDVLNISDVKNVKTISIVDIAGRLVKTIEKPSSALQLRDLNSGMYMVILNMNDGSRQTIKAIKK